MTRLNSLNDLFIFELKDLYSAETQLLDALPKMSETASDQQLKNSFSHHLEETRKQKERLEQIGKELNVDLSGETCEAMEGLVKEGEEIINSDADNIVKDAALIAAAQRVEHYEMAGYGTVRNYAKRLGYDPIANLLNETLNEEKNADSKLNEVAITHVNAEAENV